MISLTSLVRTVSRHWYRLLEHRDALTERTDSAQILVQNYEEQKKTRQLYWRLICHRGEKHISRVQLPGFFDTGVIPRCAQ